MYIEDVLETGRVVDQDTFEFMIEEGVPADAFVNSVDDYNTGKVVESLEEKDLIRTERVEETIHYFGDPMGEPFNMKESGYKRVERLYVRFTEELEDLYRE